MGSACTVVPVVVHIPTEDSSTNKLLMVPLLENVHPAFSIFKLLTLSTSLLSLGKFSSQGSGSTACLDFFPSAWGLRRNSLKCLLASQTPAPDQLSFTKVRTCSTNHSSVNSHSSASLPFHNRGLPVLGAPASCCTRASTAELRMASRTPWI